MADNRSRNFATIVYPESAPADWLSILRDVKVPAFVSPLHDKDKLSIDSVAFKKPHYHIFMMFEGKKNPEQVRDIFRTFGGVGCEVVQSARGMARYLCHLDDPEKTLYSVNDVIEIAGSDYAKFVDMVDNLKVIRQIQHWIQDTRCSSFNRLFDYALFNEPQWYRVLCGRSMWVIREYINSCKFSEKDDSDDVPFSDSLEEGLL